MASIFLAVLGMLMAHTSEFVSVFLIISSLVLCDVPPKTKKTETVDADASTTPEAVATVEKK